MLTLGPPEAEEQLRDALAIGIDRAVHLVTDGSDWDPEATTAALVAAIEAERAAGNDPDLIVFGIGVRRHRQLPGRDPRRARARAARA